MSEGENLAERARRARAAIAAAGAPWVPPEVALAVSRPDGSVDADDVEGARPRRRPDRGAGAPGD